MSPSEASRELFLAARACPRSLSTSLAPSRSPPASSSAFFTSIIPAAVSSRSCFIFSIVLAKPLPLLVLSRSRRLGSLGLGVVLLGSLGLGLRLVGLLRFLSLGLPLLGLGLLGLTGDGLPRVGLFDLGGRAGLRLRGLDSGRVDGGLRPVAPCRRRAGCGPVRRGRFGPFRFSVRRLSGRGLLRLGAPVYHRFGSTLGGDTLGGLLGDLRLLDHRRQRAVGGRDGLLSASLHDNVAYEARDQGYRPDRVVVAGDHVVPDLGVAGGVGEGDHRDLEPVGLLDEQLLALGVYDEDGPGEALHLGYPGEVAPELLVLAVQREPSLPGALLLGGLLDPARQVLEVLDARQDRLEVGQDTAYVALGDVRLSATQGLLRDRDLGLFLGADEEYLALRLGDPAHEVQGLVEERERLVQVYYVDPRPLGEDVALHLGVPALGLVPEVDPGF